MIYKDGRPFWIDDEINAYHCAFDFSGPSYHMFIITFMYPYVLIIYLMKYATEVHYKSVFIGALLLVLGAIWTFVAGLYLGTVYLY